MDISSYITPPLSWETGTVPSLAKTQNMKVANYIPFTEESIAFNNHFITVDFLKKNRRKDWEDMGVSFLPIEHFDEKFFSQVFTNSLQKISLFDNLLASIKHFLKHLVLIVPDNQDIDISLTDPTFPYTVFISIPEDSQKNCVDRFTEGLIHEVLHLQLTAIEDTTPLIYDNKLKQDIFSPWKGEGRDARGLLHAVYVFSSLLNFWTRVSNNEETSCSFALKRIKEIREELSASMHLLESEALTPSGRKLASYHLKNPN